MWLQLLNQEFAARQPQPVLSSQDWTNVVLGVVAALNAWITAWILRQTSSKTKSSSSPVKDPTANVSKD